MHVFSHSNLLRSLSLVLISISLLACKPAADKSPATAPAAKTFATDITGADFAQALSLTDHNGKATTLTDFKGKIVVLFFGYTHCPDVCPTTMSDLNLALKKMGNKASQVQVLFAQKL